MKLLEETIRERAKIISPEMIKVSSFLSHMIDTKILEEIGNEIRRLFGDKNITKVLTIETSGIPFAVIAALKLGNIPMVYAQKHHPLKANDVSFNSTVYSHSRKTSYLIHIDKIYLNPADRILIIDDFLAHGQSAKGLLHLAKQAGATVVAYCAMIEKSFQEGRHSIMRDYPEIPIYSLANIEEVHFGEIKFVGE